MTTQRGPCANTLVLLLSSVPLLVVFITSVTAVFNYTKCPAPWELQSEAVKQNFSLKKFEGFYHELALHDYTQYPVCPSPKCIQSHKIIDYQRKQINDTFNLICFGTNSTIHFRFALTNITGFFLGNVTLFPYITFPDTVVDVYENSEGVYEWVIEFQCLEKFDHVTFVGINWYSRSANVSKDYYENMLSVARKRGLGVYMDDGLKVYQVDQNCTKDSIRASEYDKPWIYN